MTGWAVCPACGAVIARPGVHAEHHHRLATWAAVTAAVDPTTTTAAAMWTGDPVPDLTDAPTDAEAATAAIIREQAGAAMTAYEQAIALLDDYLLDPPAPVMVPERVHTLTLVARGLVIAARDIIRLTVRKGLLSQDGGGRGALGPPAARPRQPH